MIDKTTAVAFLQQTWVRDPARTERMIARIGRRPVISGLLFACRGFTGRRLLATLGPDLCGSITWENADPRIAGSPSARAVADVDHMRRVLAEIEPDLAILFGNVARDAFFQCGYLCQVAMGPHPAARQIDTSARLRALRTELETSHYEWTRKEALAQ